MSRRISAARMRPGLVVALAALACAGALAQARHVFLGGDDGPGLQSSTVSPCCGTRTGRPSSSWMRQRSASAAAGSPCTT